LEIELRENYTKIHQKNIEIEALKKISNESEKEKKLMINKY
jgi:hypothetical protein